MLGHSNNLGSKHHAASVLFTASIQSFLHSQLTPEQILQLINSLLHLVLSLPSSPTSRKIITTIAALILIGFALPSDEFISELGQTFPKESSIGSSNALSDPSGWSSLQSQNVFNLISSLLSSTAVPTSQLIIGLNLIEDLAILFNDQDELGNLKFSTSHTHSVNLVPGLTLNQYQRAKIVFIEKFAQVLLGFNLQILQFVLSGNDSTLLESTLDSLKALLEFNFVTTPVHNVQTLPGTFTVLNVQQGIAEDEKFDNLNSSRPLPPSPLSDLLLHPSLLTLLYNTLEFLTPLRQRNGFHTSKLEPENDLNFDSLDCKESMILTVFNCLQLLASFNPLPLDYLQHFISTLFDITNRRIELLNSLALLGLVKTIKILTSNQSSQTKELLPPLSESLMRLTKFGLDSRLHTDPEEDEDEDSGIELFKECLEIWLNLLNEFGNLLTTLTGSKDFIGSLVNLYLENEFTRIEIRLKIQVANGIEEDEELKMGIKDRVCKYFLCLFNACSGISVRRIRIKIYSVPWRFSLGLIPLKFYLDLTNPSFHFHNIFPK